MSRRNLASRYWDAYEASLEPPSGSAARNLARLQQRIEARDELESEPELGERESVPRRRVAAAGALWWGKAVGASVGLGATAVLSFKLVLMGWAVLARPSSVEPSAPAPVVEPAGASVPAPRTTESSASPSAPAEVEAAAVVPPKGERPEPSASPSTRRAAPETNADALRAELLLMDRARAALEADDASTLWRLSSEHERRFPKGALAEERRAWQAVAACELGRSDAATRAAVFLREHPESAQAQRVREACVPTRTIE